MDVEAWLAIAGVCATGAMSPGPSLAIVLKHTVSGGRGEGVRCALGHALGVGVYALVAVAGLRALVEVVRTPVVVAGSLYLVWLGVQALRSSFGERGADVEQPAGAAPEPSGGGFREGFLIAFLNPKIAVFFFALMGSVVPAEADVVERVGVAALAMAIDGLWYVLVAGVLAGTGAAARLRARGTWIGAAFGLLLIALGGSILVGLAR